jgi:type I restriction enzyme S subunit
MSEWRECTLGDAITLQRGHDLPKSKMVSGEIPVAGSNGIIGYHNISTTRGVGITIGRSGNIGNAYLYKNDFWAHNTTLYVKDFKGNDEIFIYYFLRNIDFKSFNVGSAVPTLNRNHIHPLDILIPPLPEQKAIAEVLSSLDDKIDLLHRQNKTLEQMAETLYESWVSDKDYDSTIKDLVNIQNGYAFKSKDFEESGSDRILKIKNISGGIVDIQTTDFVSSKTIANVDERFFINEGDVLIAMTGAKIGKMGVIPKTENPLWLNQRVGLFKEKYKGARFFAYLHLKSDWGLDYIENTATGSAQPNISGTGIESCEFPKFSDHEIKEYSEQLGMLFDGVIFNLGKIRTLESLRDTLLPKLMSSEIRVTI